MLQNLYCCFAVEGGGIAQFSSIGSRTPSAPVFNDYNGYEPWKGGLGAIQVGYKWDYGGTRDRSQAADGEVVGEGALAGGLVR